jgi:hypothetical protein
MPAPHAPTRNSRNPVIPGRRWIFALAVVGLVQGFALPASADADRDVNVILLRPVPTRLLFAEAIVRIKSELAAGGFKVTVTDAPAELLLPEARALKQWASQTVAPSATIAVFGDLDEGSAELWIVDRLTNKTAIHRVQVDTSADRPISEVLAIRAEELLRASLVEVQVEGKRGMSSAQPRPEVTHATVSPLPSWRFAVEAGASAFGGAGGLGPAVAPAVRLRLALGDRLWLRLTGLGFGTEPQVHRDTRSASVAESVLLAEAVAWFRQPGSVRPMVSLGLGAERFAVTGSGPLPYQGEQNARWFFAADAGAGFAVRLGLHWEMQVEAHALVPLPRPTVRFVDDEVAQAGQPTLLMVLTLAGGA